MGISIPQLLIILAIVVVLFGTKRLRNIGTDLGGAIKGFRSAMNSSEEDDKLSEKPDDVIDADVIDAHATEKKTKDKNEV